MSILAILLGLAIVGLVLWVVTTLIPMPTPYRNAVIAIVILLVVLWLVRVLGFSAAIPTAP